MKVIKGGFNRLLMEYLNCNNGRYVFTPNDSHLNAFSTIHGGVTASLVDIVTSIEIYNIKKQYGVSVDLGVQYLKPLISEFRLEPKVEKIGKALVFTSCSIYNEKNELAALGRHIKMLSNK